MIKRALYAIAFAEQWGRQIRFIPGPRQSGKTTLARQMLDAEGSGKLYYLWDLRSVRQRYKTNELFFTADAFPARQPLWVCFDEIHKMPKWKNILKAVFDETSEKYRLIVTGSAKLDVTKRAGDSLAGRYFTFHLMPLMLCEIMGRAESGAKVPASAQEFVENCRQNSPAVTAQDALQHLLEYSGFPEPFLRQSRPFYARWARDYPETVIREDIGALTRIIDREYIHDLYNLLPGLAGSPLSVSSLASHLQISPITAKNYLRRLEDFFLVFSIRPYSRNIKRSLLKTGKYYLYDWTRIADPGARFENYVACELKTRLMLWSDATGDPYELFYIRNKQKQETDFMIAHNSKPWLLVEAKLSDGPIDAHHFQAAAALGNIPLAQICRQPQIASMQKRAVYRISATGIFG
ncbi:MAG: ATP-binding protein [Kiritimatiellae bacterium]|nr:ATP-binding protein [Kiritimatiellia bacterium]